MTYTLKVDWSQQRIAAVLRALRRDRSTRLTGAACSDIELYSDPSAGSAGDVTLKFDWPERQLDSVCLALVSALDHLERDALRARDNLPGPSYDEVVSDQAQVHAALREIREYRAAVVKARKMAAETTRDEQIRDALRKDR